MRQVAVSTCENHWFRMWRVYNHGIFGRGKSLPLQYLSSRSQKKQDALRDGRKLNARREDRLGGHKEMSPYISWLTNTALVYEPICGGRGDCGVLVNEYSCAHGAKINFGDLTPYLTYGIDCALCAMRNKWGSRRWLTLCSFLSQAI